MSITQVILVDENDIQIGVEEKLAAHQTAKLHRAFSIFIFRKVGEQFEILLQKRHPDKYHTGNLWTNTCCSHPLPGEDTVVAGERRLQEEMGFTTILTHVGRFHYKVSVGQHLTENEMDHVLIGMYDDTPIVANPAEVASYQWMEITKLQNDLEQHPETYTPWFKQALQIAVAHLNSN